MGPPPRVEAAKRLPGYYYGGLSAYMEVRDKKTAFFVSRLKQGVHSITYKLRAEVPGTFNAVPTSGFAMYIPEIRGLSLDAPERREAFADGGRAPGKDAAHADVACGGAVGLEIVHEDALLRRYAESFGGQPVDARIGLRHAHPAREYHRVEAAVQLELRRPVCFIAEAIAEESQTISASPELRQCIACIAVETRKVPHEE